MTVRKLIGSKAGKTVPIISPNVLEEQEFLKPVKITAGGLVLKQGALVSLDLDRADCEEFRFRVTLSMCFLGERGSGFEFAVLLDPSRVVKKDSFAIEASSVAKNPVMAFVHAFTERYAAETKIDFNYMRGDNAEEDSTVEVTVEVGTGPDAYRAVEAIPASDLMQFINVQE